jgi:hypothetical protein
MIVRVSPAVRFVRALFVVWLTFILTQPVALHSCAMQNGTLSTVPVAVSGHAQHDMAGQMASGAHELVGGMDHSNSSNSGQPNKCHCFGDCAATASVALIAPSYAVVPAPAHVTAAPSVPAVVEQSFEQPTYLQPPATAPPIA